MPNLSPNPTSSILQEYISDLEGERGFAHQPVIDKCLLLGEEVGELFKAIRKSEGIAVDPNSNIGFISEELADIFLMLCTIANRFDIDLEQAFRDKEVINMQRQWKKAP